MVRYKTLLQAILNNPGVTLMCVIAVWLLSALAISAGRDSEEIAQQERHRQETAAVLAAAEKSRRDKCTSQADQILESARKDIKGKRFAEALRNLNRCKDVIDTEAWRGATKEANDQAARLAAAQAKQEAAAEAKRAAEEKRKKKQAGVSIGMTQQDVLDSSWGKPKRINRTTTKRGAREQWVYGQGNYLYFQDGILESIQN